MFALENVAEHPSFHHPICLPPPSSPVSRDTRSQNKMSSASAGLEWSEVVWPHLTWPSTLSGAGWLLVSSRHNKPGQSQNI